MEQFILKSGQAKRLGYTTGSCAALATQAAVRMLLSGKNESVASLTTPKGLVVTVELQDTRFSHTEACCAVQKDAGDDPDVTNGILVYATVQRIAHGVTIDGGTGVGRVTRAGLDQPIGNAAINSVPRAMIEREVHAVCQDLGYDGGISVVISIPEGERIAAKTFNAALGIVGGLSVIGTSGVVEPMSTQAMLDTIHVAMNVLRMEGVRELIITPGNYGENFIKALPDISRQPHVKCANFIGEALDTAVGMGFQSVLIVGHIGKLIKLSGGIMDTHSRIADCRLELLALHAALAGVEASRLHEVLAATTVDAGMEILGDLRTAVVESILSRTARYLTRRTGDALATGVVLCSNRWGVLGISAEGAAIIDRWKN